MYEFKALVRFVTDGKPSYGELLETTGKRFKVQKLNGDPFTGLELGSDTVEVQKLLSPLESTPLIQCIGLNYKSHAQEANLSVSKYPPVFTKPADALAGPFEDIEIHPEAQALLDYEGELTIVIGRDGKNISEDSALDYVLGYTAGNDISARNFQMPDASGGQFGYAKSFDKFAPIGPAIVSTKVIPDPQKLRLTTKVNGDLRQETSTDDMIWSVQQIIAHLSRGTTLRRGTVIMTGTPSGVGMFRREFLKNGDVVEVGIEGIGRVSNTMRF